MNDGDLGILMCQVWILRAGVEKDQGVGWTRVEPDGSEASSLGD